MPTDFQKAKRRVKLANGNWSKPISYLTSSESVEMTDGSNLQTTINNKVDKVTGKDLSTNDYTDADKIAVSSLGTASTKDVGTANGVAELDSNGKVPSSQLPSYVDDVIEGYYNSSTDRFYEESTFETVIPPEGSKSWVDIPSNKSYRWTGSVYTRVDEGVQLGETSSTAYRGDRGKTAYDHSQTTGNPHGTTKNDIGLGNVNNTADLDKPISTATQTELDKKETIQSSSINMQKNYQYTGHYGVKNLIELTVEKIKELNGGESTWNGNSKTISGLTYTIITDENNNVSGIMASGTYTGTNDYCRLVVFKDFEAHSNLYTINNYDGNIELEIISTNGTIYYSEGVVQQGRSIDIGNSDLYFNGELRIPKNITVSDSIAKPMIRPYVVTSPTFEPYAKSNQQLTHDISTSLTATGNPLTIESSESNLVECVAEIEAVQDLHGYDHPWVGGAGKNILPLTISRIKELNTAGTWSGNNYTVYGVTYSFDVNEGGSIIKITVGGNNTSSSVAALYLLDGDYEQLYAGTIYVSGSTNSNSSKCYMQMNKVSTGGGSASVENNIPNNTAYLFDSTNYRIQLIIYFRNGVNESGFEYYPMVSKTNDLTFEPYSNISPITGQTEVVIQRDGVNLFDKNSLESTNHYLIANGSYVNNENWRVSDYIRVEGGQTIIAYNYASAADPSICWYDKDKAYIGGQSYGSSSVTVQLPNNAYYVKLSVRVNYLDSAMLIYGSQPISYIPYKGKTYRVEIGQKNKFNKDDSSSIIDGFINAGAISASTSAKTIFVKCKPNTQYTVSKTAGARFSVGYTTTQPQAGTTVIGTITNHTASDITIKTGTDAQYLVAFVYNSSYDTITAEQMLATVQVEQGSQATPYVPYNPNLPDAIYGGELDVLTGEMRVDRGIITVNDFTVISNQTSSGGLHWSDTTVTFDKDKQAISSMLRLKTGSNGWNSTTPCFDASDGNAIRVYCTESNITDFKLTYDDLQICYPLATPYTIQLTPQQIRLLKGTNHLSCNTGDLSIKYYPDNVLGQLKGDIESEYDDRVEALEEKADNAMQKGADYVTAGQLSGSTLGDKATAEGSNTVASGDSSHAEGSNTVASSESSHAEGYHTTASGTNSHAEGSNTTASNFASHAGGHYNAVMTTGGTGANTTGTAFVIGNGTLTALSNAFSVQYNGVVKAASTITASTTADYAEFFEWFDENSDNEDRVGLFVTNSEEDYTKIRIANSNDDYILGIVSGDPFVLGNGDCDVWNGMMIRDDFGRVIYEPAQKYEINPETGELEPVYDDEGNPVYEGTKPVYNPEYDPTIPYISRFDRPEWSPIGMLGVLRVYDDGTCEVGGYCTVGEDGKATKVNTYDKSTNCYKVIERITDDIIKVIFR